MNRASQTIEMNRLPLASDVDEHLLLREVTHRINNEYAFVVNAISLRAEKSPDPAVRIALTEVGSLLMQFADVHRALMFPADGCPVEICAYLRELCGAVACARLKRRKIRLLLIESEPQLLSAERGWKLGLSVSELITNASKHAFGANGGLVRVELARDGAMMKCCVRDNGRNEGVSRPGQGLTLIRSLVQSVGGTLDYAFGKSGGISLISMPGWEGLKRVK